jgi:hypothetical protein
LKKIEENSADLEREGDVSEEEGVAGEEGGGIDDLVGSLSVANALLAGKDVRDLTEASPMTNA